MAKHSNKIDPSTFKERIIDRNIGELSTEWEMIFGTNRNVYRHFPSLIDGLKPGERRFLYTLYINGKYKGKMVKLASASSGTTLIHPHAPESISDVAVAMAQDWVTNVELVYVPGNEGSIRGDDRAADRYLDISMSDFAYDCYFSDFKNSNVDMKLSYLGDMEEPEYLPAKYPIAIIKGGFNNIGYAYASNVPPFNFKEVCEATIALIKDHNAKILIYPDIPTGAEVIMTKKECKHIMENGIDGKVQMRSHAEIDYINNIITFTSIPIQTTTKQIISRLISLKLADKIPELKDIKDRTNDKNGVQLELELDNNANPEDVLEKLYSLKTMLKKSIKSCITLVDDYKSKEYSVREFLLQWIDYRRDTLRSSFNNKLVKLLEEDHINKVKLFIFSKERIERTLELSRSSSSKEEYMQKLMKEYGISSLQASVIADMRTSAFTKDSYKDFKDTEKELEEEIRRIRDILRYDGSIDKEIIRELEEGIEKYGEPRRSIVINDENKISDDNVLIGISDDGYIKKVIANVNEPIGAISKSNNVLHMVVPATEKDSLLLFDSKGVMHVLPVSSLPMLKSKNTGLKISKYIKTNDAVIVSANIAPRSTTKGDTYDYIMITQLGVAKRVSVSALLKSGKLTKGSSTNAIILNENDRLAVVLCTNNKNQNVLFFTDFGDGMRLPIEEFPSQLPGSKGTKMVTLRNHERIIGANLMEPTDEYLVYVTSLGKVKRTEMKFFPEMKRKDEPMALVNLDDGEVLVSVKSVNAGNKLSFYKKNSKPEVISVSDIPIRTRAAKAEKLIKVNRGDSVLSMIVK